METEPRYWEYINKCIGQYSFLVLSTFIQFSVSYYIMLYFLHFHMHFLYDALFSYKKFGINGDAYPYKL